MFVYDKIYNMQKKELMTRQHIQKADILLMAFFLFLALLLGIWFLVGQQRNAMLVVSYNGMELYTLNLEDAGILDSVTSNQKEQYLLITYSDSKKMPEITSMYTKPEIPSGTVYNLLCISGETVRMDAADCKDQICVQHKPISGNRECIICLPHKLVVEITDDSQEDVLLDGMVK